MYIKKILLLLTIASVWNVEGKIAPVQVELFFNQGCGQCDIVKREILPDLEKKYDGKYTLTFCDLADSKNYMRLVQYQEAFQCTSNEPVYMVVNFESILAGVKEIRARLFSEIELATSHPNSHFAIDDAQGAELLSNRFRKFSYMAIALAGLIDGINPCVFAALIFFISLLAMMRVTGRKILVVGAVYCFACFLSYLAIGFGLISFLQKLSKFEYIRTVLEYAALAMVMVFAVISFIDAFRYQRSKKADRILLQLPAPLKQKIHRLMRRGLEYRYLLPGIFATAIIVTVIESVCTGQIYLPTLIFLMREKGFGIWFFYLLLYNFMFIVPLLVIFYFAYRGTSAMAFIQWSKRQVICSKLLMGVFFLMMAFLMWHLVHF